MKDSPLKTIIGVELVQQAREGRARRAWLDGRDTLPEIEWPDPEPVQVLPPAIIEREPRPGMTPLGKFAGIAAIVMGATGIGAGGAYLGHLASSGKSDTPPAAVVPGEAQADVLQWLSENGYNRSP
ncbi:MAG: hypothetical protein O3C40_31730 [Planctomycetota bacterium]|nr:hypothetical protein [Planctomycetota bacterium]